MKRRFLSPAVAACLAAFFAIPAMANFSGAIYTTDSTGTAVNQNLYATKDQVYLSGGPQPRPGGTCGGVALADGTYYFRVTNPNGTLDLSALAGDPIGNRTFTVTNGVWSYLGTHAFNPSPCGSGILVIQLIPYNDTDNPAGVYKAWLSTDQLFSNDLSKTDNFKVSNPSCGDCNPPPQSTITGEKFYDTNGNGALDPGELGIPGWQITIGGTAVDSTNPTFTDSSGLYIFVVDQNTGQYTISEVFPPAPVSGPQWVATTATSGTADSTSDVNQGPNFGNVCRGLPGNGLTLGFWSNKNGEALMTGSANGQAFKPAVSSLLGGLPLVNASGTHVTFANYTAFRTWILSATSVNAAYMLSAQLATMELNVLLNGVSTSELVQVTDPVLITALGLTANGHGDYYVQLGALLSAAITELAAHPLTVAAGPDRTYEVSLQTLLNSLNNNLAPVILGAGSCPFVTPY